MTGTDIVLSYLARKGWQTTTAGSGWQVHQPDCQQSLYLSATPSWICLQAPLDYPDGLFAGALDPAQQASLYRRLLRENEQMFMAKFCLDHTGRPLLAVELPQTGSIHLIDHALDAMTRHLPVAWDAPLPDAIPPGHMAKDRFFAEPPGIPHEVIGYYVKAVEGRGWGLRDKPKGITWLLGYKGQRMFEAYLTVTKPWAYFHVPVPLEVPADLHRADPTVQAALLAYLLRVNDAWYMAKLGTDEQDRVLLMLELPTQELDFDRFRMVTFLLATYLDTYAREIQIMAHLESDRQLRQLLVER
jgi:hypothetical protein